MAMRALSVRDTVQLNNKNRLVDHYDVLSSLPRLQQAMISEL